MFVTCWCKDHFFLSQNSSLYCTSGWFLFPPDCDHSKRDVYSQVSEMFSPYFKYCAEQTACQQYCKDQDRDNQVFKAYLAVRSSKVWRPLTWSKCLFCCSGAKLNETATVWGWLIFWCGPCSASLNTHFSSKLSSRKLTTSARRKIWQKW